MPAWCDVLRVRCPGPRGSWSLVCSLGALRSVCGLMGHLAPVHRCAHSACCVACAVSWATWLLLTAVHAWRVALCVCGVLGHLAPVHPGARLVCGVACAVSRATWLPSPVCSLGVWCCVRGVLGLLAHLLRFARSVCRAVCCVCGVLGHLAPVHRCARWMRCVACAGPRCRMRTRLSGRRLVVAGRRSVPSGRAHVHPDGGCFVAGRGWVHCLGHTRPSERRLFRGPQGLGSLLGRHASIRTAAGVAWNLFLCRCSLRVVRAVRVCGTRPPLLLATCPCALVVEGGVPLWHALWPRVVCRGSSGPVALGAPVGCPVAVLPFPTPGAVASGFTGRLRGARGGRPRTRLIVPPAGPGPGSGTGLAPRCTRSGPRDGVVPGGSLRLQSWAACAAVVCVCGPGH